MWFRIVGDSNIEAGLSEVLHAKSASGFEEYFSDKFYDDSGLRLGVVLMCRDPELKFKQRISISKKDNTLYLDLMLDSEQMERADLATRKQIVGEKIVNEVPQIVAKKKFKDFDLPRFSRDLREWFEKQGWVSEIFAEEEIFFEKR